MRSGTDCRFSVCGRVAGQMRSSSVGELRTLELKRSRGSVRMEKDLEFDTLFWRHTRRDTARAGPVSAGRDPHYGPE